MANNINVRRHVVQVSEIPVAPAVQTLAVVGNDICAVTQQDLRKVVDFRMFTLSPCQPRTEAALLTILMDLFAQEPPKTDNNPYVKQEVLKVSETPMAPAVHIPILVGCEQFVVIQQDIRKELDIRMFTYSRLNPVAFAAAAPLNVFGGPVTNLQQSLFSQAPQVPHVTIDPYNFNIQILKKPTIDIALGRSNNQLCYSTGTSTDGLMKNNGCQHCPKSEEIHSSCQTQTSPPSLDENVQKNVGCQTQPATSCTGCNTSSSLQMVRKVEMEEEDEDSDPCHPCTDRELFAQQEPVVWNPKCRQERPCTSRLIDMEDDRRRYDFIRTRIRAQRLGELRRQRQQDYDSTLQTPPPRKCLLSYDALNRERRQRNNR